MSVLSVMLLVSAAINAPPVEVRTVAGKTLSGTLKEISVDRVVLQTGSGEQAILAKDLLEVAVRARPAKEAARPQAWIDLVDGGRLIGLEYTTRKGEAALKLLDGREVNLPTRAIAAVRLKEQDARISQQWADIAAAKHASDVIVIRREESIDFLEGVLGDALPDAVQFTVDGDLVNVKRPRVEGFLYFHPQADQPPAAACQVHTHDGSRLSAVRLALDGDELTIATPSGLKIKRPLESVKELDFSLGKLRYLSDLEWESIERHDYLSVSDAKPHRFYEPRKDHSFLGPLQLGTKVYAKGLALKSYTRLTYRLPGKFTRLTGVAGINAMLAPAGHVRLVISGEGQKEPLLETIIAGDGPPQELSLDLSGVRRLIIEVDFAEGGDAGDHLNLCDVRIIQ